MSSSTTGTVRKAVGTVRGRKGISKDQISNPTDFEHIQHAGKEDIEQFLAQLEAEAETSNSQFSRARIDYDTSTVKIKKPEEVDAALSAAGSGIYNTVAAKARPSPSLPWSMTGQPTSPVEVANEVEEKTDGGNDDKTEKDGLSFLQNLNLEEIQKAPLSQRSVEKALATRIWMENYFENLMKGHYERDSRRTRLEEELERKNIQPARREEMRKRLYRKETDYMRLRRRKVNKDSFEDLKIIGKGAFGVVKLVMEKENRQVYAMKCLNKAEMLRKRQEGHVRAERDLLASASDCRSIVHLFHSFQDKDYLYLVMEFMGGGDLLNLLIKMDIFPEDFARFYMAEMVVAIGEVHKLGFIHRDVKPDNFLITSTGHIKISDFGLCTGFHWAHDAKFYEQQRKLSASLLDKKIDELKANNAQKMQELINNDMEPKDRVLFWRKQNRKSMAYSVVGTNNYIAPEVLLQVGYGFECDWWSLGVILFEMLFGYPPFCSDSRQNTKLKIVNWRQTLKFPPKPKVSAEAKHLIQSLICDHSNRLGKNGVEEIKAHPFFRGINWDTLLDSKPPWTPQLKSPYDTAHFDNFDDDKSPGQPAAGEKSIRKAASEEYSEDQDNFAFYGFTHRGFYNLTRKDTSGSGGKNEMDPLQAAVLRELEKDNLGGATF